MSDEAMTKTLYEKLLIQYMFKDDEVRNILVPHLSPEVFMNHLNSQCVKSVMQFLEAHSHFPRMNELKLFIKETEIYEHLLEIMNIDTSEYDRDFILGELEEFYRKSLFANVIMDSSENIRNTTDTLQNYPDKLREALAFTFNSSIGTSLLDDQEKIFDAMHDKDKVISTGIKYLDRLIEGGCHEKSLNLLMAACVVEDTKVSVKIVHKGKITTAIKKICEIPDIDGFVQICSPDGYVPVKSYINKGLKNVYKLTVKGCELIGSGKHLVETRSGWKFLEDLKNGDEVSTAFGFFECVIENLNEERVVVDIEVDHPNHRYYTNWISSHNTNVGKSLIMCALSKNFLTQNKKVLYISLEMSEEKIVERLLANIFDVALNDLKTMPKAEFMRRYELIRKFLKSDFKVVQYGAKTVSSNKIRSILKDYQVKKNYTPDVLIVDYLGLMNTNNKSKDSNSYSEMKLISEELRAVAVEYGMPIWSAMQTNRNGFKNVELELTDIADSIGTAATADLIIGVTQNDELKEAGKFIWYILKNRYGLNDQKLFVGVDYPKMRIYGLESEEKEELVKPKNIVDDSSVQILKALESNKKSKIDNLSGVE
jgi:replicative DNA helicase